MIDKWQAETRVTKGRVRPSTDKSRTKRSHPDMLSTGEPAVQCPTKEHKGRASNTRPSYRLYHYIFRLFLTAAMLHLS
ncbi:hypothetical protein E2C01_100567 [Portunus trituberculatus]|uniref:Uncharacterized protein n=1 Tax=Portunus trituberculatus TaxID=210409 RepID=A0A5B7KDD8_PORTR|nr:hypothetical protein [Portunus trituberculatus]